MRSVEQQLERLVCAAHCRYYRPWATPEPDCGSLAWVSELVGRRGEALDAIERLRESRALLPLAQDRILLQRICVRCLHYPYNCAYRRPDGSPDAVPCGGLVVLDQLLERRVITAGDLYADSPQRERLPA
jgi:hypothetical protein